MATKLIPKLQTGDQFDVNKYLDDQLYDGPVNNIYTPTKDKLVKKKPRVQSSSGMYNTYMDDIDKANFANNISNSYLYDDYTDEDEDSDDAEWLYFNKLIDDKKYDELQRVLDSGIFDNSFIQDYYNANPEKINSIDEKYQNQLSKHFKFQVPKKFAKQEKKQVGTTGYVKPVIGAITAGVNDRMLKKTLEEANKIKAPELRAIETSVRPIQSIAPEIIELYKQGIGNLTARRKTSDTTANMMADQMTIGKQVEAMNALAAQQAANLMKERERYDAAIAKNQTSAGEIRNESAKLSAAVANQKVANKANYVKARQEHFNKVASQIQEGVHQRAMFNNAAKIQNHKNKVAQLKDLIDRTNEAIYTIKDIDKAEAKRLSGLVAQYTIDLDELQKTTPEVGNYSQSMAMAFPWKRLKDQDPTSTLMKKGGRLTKRKKRIKDNAKATADKYDIDYKDKDFSIYLPEDDAKTPQMSAYLAEVGKRNNREKRLTTKEFQLLQQAEDEAKIIALSEENKAKAAEELKKEADKKAKEIKKKKEAALKKKNSLSDSQLLIIKNIESKLSTMDKTIMDLTKAKKEKEKVTNEKKVVEDVVEDEVVDKQSKSTNYAPWNYSLMPGLGDKYRYMYKHTEKDNPYTAWNYTYAPWDRSTRPEFVDNAEKAQKAYHYARKHNGFDVYELLKNINSTFKLLPRTDFEINPNIYNVELDRIIEHVSKTVSDMQNQGYEHAIKNGAKIAKIMKGIEYDGKINETQIKEIYKLLYNSDTPNKKLIAK